MLLNCHTYYSYKFGTINIGQLIQEAIDKGYRSLVLTDINNTSAAIDFIRLCEEKDIKPVVGIDFRNGAQQKYIGITRNNNGFRALNEHLTYHLHSGERIPDRAPEIAEAYFIYPIGAIHPKELRENEFIGIRPAQVNRIFGDLRNHLDKLVVLQPVTFRNKRDFNIHRLLRAIDNNTLLSLLPKSEEASPDEIMWPRQDIYEQFRDFPQLIHNAQKIIDSCSIEFTFRKSKNKQCFYGSPAEDFIMLRKLAWEGVRYRFGEPSPKIAQRIEKELAIIKQMDFAAYFLINWDLIQHARSRGCYYVGRGSGANSMIAYLLRITDVDPVELDLYFERFINPSRKSPPDFDIDFASRDRNHITKYIFDRYGWDHTALVGTHITFQDKSLIRELGKVFGLPNHEIEKLQRVENLQDVNEDIARLVIKYSRLIHGFPSHLSVHSSGILISEEPISTFTATILPPKGFPTVHFNMIEAEDIGFAKFDILGQRGLSKIEDTISIIRENKGDEIDIHDLPAFKKDEQVKELLKHGNTIGCFYVESPAMRMLLTKLEADDYLRLVAASSIIRPGVAQSGMMREYILRYRDRSRCVAAEKEAPELYELLKETYGVMVYQEDVIKVAHLFARLTLAESDILRRGMSWKFKQRNEFGKVKDKFFSNCAEKGYDYALVHRVWTQIESFANYAFSKGHSASYAVESYQALFLKAYYPLEYMVATINNGGGFYRTDLYVHEARIHGGKIFPPCVNRSNEETVIGGKVIFLGLGFLKSLETATIQAVLDERHQGGYYRSLQDFLIRVPISLEQVSILIRVGAFNFTQKSKKELLWNAHFILSKSKKTTPERTLFQQEVKEFSIPDLYFHPLEDAYDEIELLGFPVTRSPFGLLEELKLPQTTAADLSGLIGKNVSIVGSLVNIKYTRSGNGRSMTFGVFIDYEGHWIDTVQFPNVAEKYPFRGGGCYLISGKVMEEFGFISIETTELYRLPNENMEEPSTRLKVPKTMELKERNA
ncbi:MAG: DNA polymerase III subunit alpha [Draconibacterium sp.]